MRLSPKKALILQILWHADVQLFHWRALSVQGPSPSLRRKSVKKKGAKRII